MTPDPAHYIRSRTLEDTSLVWFSFSTRLGGVSPPPLGMNTSLNVGDAPEQVQENRRRLLASIHSTPAHLALPRQVHSDVVRRADAPGSFPDCDALITDRKGVVLGISAADCVPVFMVDVRRKSIAAVHAGWRGTAKHIVSRTVEAMTREYHTSPGDIVAFIGPCASVCCYDVGNDVAQQFPPSAVLRNGPVVRVDLKAENVRQLTLAGVPPVRIEVSPHCTISDDHLFHSHRRDRERSGRMMGVIVLREPRMTIH